jgi:acetyl-CoA carboxylase carboxyl transferase subunit beta
MSWLKREKEGILTSTENKMEAPDGLWTKCPSCKTPTHIKELRDNLHICPACGYHYKIGSQEYFSLLFDGGKYQELDANMTSGDPLQFKDSKPYPLRIEETQKKTGLKDALRTGYGKLEGMPIVISCMDFGFIGGSMGSVVGEKIARGIVYAIAHNCPFLMISKSGGARMMEGALSLMQMAKTSARLAQLAEKGLPYISLLTDPTTGGVTASYAMLGDFNIAEPEALIGFAGPRVIRETIGKDLPDGFQSSEFLVEHGFVDFIVRRQELKAKIAELLGLLKD